MYSVKELLGLGLAVLPGSERGIVKRADQENWSFTWETVQGGQRKMYRAHILPDYVRKAMLDQEQITALVPAQPSHYPAVINGPSLTPEEQKAAYQKAALLRLYLQAVTSAAWGKKDAARESFIIAYNAGVLAPELYQALGPLGSWKTIEGWKGIIKKSGGNALRLADRRGHVKKGQRSITSDHVRIILAVVRQPKGKSRPKSEIIDQARKAMRLVGLDTLSAATYRRWLEEWIAVNYDEWVWWREGDKGLNDKCMFWVERDYDRIEVGDILVADGHVLNFTVMNPWTGKASRMMLVLFFDMKSSYPAGWVIMPSENTAAISSALKLAILRLGKIPKIVYIDNGRAFKGQAFTGVDFDQTELPGIYENLGIRLIVAKPYHGQSKTIERFFLEFGELERMAPTYVGASIETKPAHLNRGEKLHRRIHEKIVGDWVPTIEEAMAAVGAWFDEYASREHGPNSHMAGLRPVDLFDAGRGPGVDPSELRTLMLRTTSRMIHAKGVTVNKDSGWYYHPSLYGRKHKVDVLHDLPPRDSVLVYDQRNGEFICEAKRFEKVHPAAAILGTPEDVAELSAQLEMREGLRKGTIAGAKAFADAEAIPEARRLLESAGFALPEPAGSAQPERRQLPAPVVKLDEEKLAREVAENARLHTEMETAQTARQLENMEEFDRYGFLLEREMRGEELTTEWRRFMRTYEQMMNERDTEYWEGQRTALAILYGQKEMAAVDAAAQA